MCFSIRQVEWPAFNTSLPARHENITQHLLPFSLLIIGRIDQGPEILRFLAAACKNCPVGSPCPSDVLSNIYFFEGFGEEFSSVLFLIGGLLPARLTFQRIQSLTALVDRLSFVRITCAAHHILENLVKGTPSLLFGFVLYNHE
uniref:Uncharacterized protein n=1 Tax=Angiostrongylus cantonensis TaxID=6313 RepID=A0A0K0DF28_ANGCA